jgi:hypothetical protein
MAGKIWMGVWGSTGVRRAVIWAVAFIAIPIDKLPLEALERGSLAVFYPEEIARGFNGAHKRPGRAA